LSRIRKWKKIVATYNAFAEQLSEQPVQNHSICNISYLRGTVGHVTNINISKLLQYLTPVENTINSSRHNMIASSEISAATISRGSETPLCIWRWLCTFNIKSWKWIRFFLQLDGLPRRNNISYLKWKISINKNYLSKYTAKPWDLDAKFVFSQIIRNQIILLNEKKDTNACQHFILPTSFSINKKIWQDFCW